MENDVSYQVVHIIMYFMYPCKFIMLVPAIKVLCQHVDVRRLTKDLKFPKGFLIVLILDILCCMANVIELTTHYEGVNMLISKLMISTLVLKLLQLGATFFLGVCCQHLARWKQEMEAHKTNDALIEAAEKILEEFRNLKRGSSLFLWVIFTFDGVMFTASIYFAARWYQVLSALLFALGFIVAIFANLVYLAVVLEDSHVDFMLLVDQIR